MRRIAPEPARQPPRRVCFWGLCAMPTMPPHFRAHGARTDFERNRQADQRRGSASERGYDGKWAKASAGHRVRSPLCRYCEVGAFGPPHVRPATLVDHLYPHRGDTVLFWNKLYWVSSCGACHSGPKQAVEAKGRRAIDVLAGKLALPPLAA